LLDRPFHMRTRAVATLALVAAALLRPAVARATTAADICDAAADPCTLEREVVADPGSVLDFGVRAFVIKAPDGRLEVPAGATLTISAGSMVVETGAGGRVRSGSGGASTIDIQLSGTFAVRRAGSSSVGIDVASNTEPCTIDIDAGGDVTIAGEIHAQGAESGGEVYIKTAGRMTIADRILVDSGFFGGIVGLDATGPIELTADGDVDASSAVGFGSIEINTSADLISAGRLEAKARFSDAFGCDGGTIGLNAEGNVTINGPIAVDGDLEGCVGGFVGVLAGGSIFVNAEIDLSGGPNGQGGSFEQVEAGKDFMQAAPILAGSGGLRGWGGEMDIAVGGRLHVGALLDLGGGPQIDTDTGDRGRGGDLALTAGGALEIAAEVAADGADYGSLVFTTTRDEDTDVPGRIVVTGNVHALASAEEDESADVRFEACEIEIAAGGSVRKEGPASRNLLRASGPMRIAGTLVAGSGTNVLEYRDLTRPPLIVPGAVVSPTATVSAPAEPLRPCACTLDPGAAGFLCNDGNPCTQEACDRVEGCVSTPLPGEGIAGCDDGNACDGREVCAALACQPGPIPPADDGDPCTDDGACDPATGYVRTPKTGFGAATCRMERIESALAAASVPGDVSAKSLKKIRKLARTVRNAIEKAGAAGGKRRAKLLKAATKKIQRLDQVITSPKTSITTQLSQTLTATTSELRGALTQLQ